MPETHNAALAEYDRQAALHQSWKSQSPSTCIYGWDLPEFHRGANRFFPNLTDLGLLTLGNRLRADLVTPR